METTRYCACPYCTAIFHLPEAKYRCRGGIVRCGTCREVFDANENLVNWPCSRLQPADAHRPLPAEVAGSDNTDSTDSPPLADASDNARAVPLKTAIPDPLGDINPAAERAGVESFPHADDTAHYQLTADPFGGRYRHPHACPVLPDPEDTCHTRSSDDPQRIHGDTDNWLVTPGIEPIGDPENPPPPSPSPATDTPLARMQNNDVDQYIRERRSPWSALLWSLAAIGFSLLLAIQVKYSLVDRYAQDPQIRSYLQVFCKVAQCRLPARQEPWNFTLTHTRIDLHPTVPNAMRVTVKLVNEAGFAQPYPILQLTLTDRVGRVVGRRAFQPEHYLPEGEANMLDQGEFTSVLFDLARPHKEAVGFAVDIIKNPVSS